MSRHVTFMTIDDAAHYSADERAAIVAAYPEHEREARARGIPVLGSGRIFPVAEALIACEPFRLPRYWPRLGALDFGWDHPSAAVELAWDTEADVVYVCKAARASQQTPAMQTLTLKPWGDWLPWAWPRDGRRETLEGAGVALAKQYGAHGLNMLSRHAQFADGSVSVEAGLMDMLDRMQSGRFKVFSTLTDWFEEFRLYHRKDGQVVKLRDDLMAATRYRKLTLSYVSGTGTLPTTAGGVWLMFDRAGDKGIDGAGAGDFTGPASSAVDNIVTFGGTTGKVGKDSGIKAVDLIAGPASAVTDNIVTFNGTTGKIAKDSGVAMSSLAPKASPTFTGTPAAPTAAAGTNTTQIATTGFVKAAVDVVLGGVSTAFDTLSEIAAAMLQKAVDNTGITAGFTSVVADDGTKSSGTYAPSPVGGNFRKCINNGAFTLAAPSTSGSYNLELDITNGASAGVVTFSGFATGYPKGSSLTMTSGHKFKLHIHKSDAGVTATIEALQ
ncbi:terminase large subunit domain-containing protein [Mesorhizobium sp. ES1-1]|uniref:phage terminase large subunit family protein n=1 Tax=Mesorhizobium sp. ES1-1 TaxID=2876629 RepID=UPI00398CC364